MSTSLLSINAIDAKEEFSELIHRVSHNKERIIITTRRGQEIAALVPYEDLHFLQQVQNKTDLQEAVEALREARKEGVITIEEMMADLGDAP